MVFFMVFITRCARPFFLSHQRKNQRGWCFSWYLLPDALGHSFSHIRERIKEDGVFHGIFLLFKVFFLFPSSWFGDRRHFRGCLAFFGWSSFAAATAFSLLPPSEGRLDRRLGVFIAKFSPGFYRRLGYFYRRLGCFYRHIVWFFLAYLVFFL